MWSLTIKNNVEGRIVSTDIDQRGGDETLGQLRALFLKPLKHGHSNFQAIPAHPEQMKTIMKCAVRCSSWEVRGVRRRLI